VFGILKAILLSSVGLAVYGLLIMLFNFNSQLTKYSMFSKFLIIKIALFFTIWQGILMRIINVNEKLPLKTMRDGHEVRINTTVCLDGMLVNIEMFFLTIIMLKSYSPDEFKIEGETESEKKLHDKGLKGLFSIL
jgi:hypothetical protein